MMIKDIWPNITKTVSRTIVIRLLFQVFSEDFHKRKYHHPLNFTGNEPSKPTSDDDIMMWKLVKLMACDDECRSYVASGCDN